MKPKMPVATALLKMPRAATTLNPMSDVDYRYEYRRNYLLRILCFFCDVARGIEAR